MEISKSKNKNPLPPIKYHAGIRLPPDRFCLHAQNYALKTPNVSLKPYAFNLKFKLFKILKKFKILRIK